MPRYQSHDSAPRARSGRGSFRGCFPPDVVQGLERCQQSGEAFRQMDGASADAPCSSTSAGFGVAPWLIVIGLIIALRA